MGGGDNVEITLPKGGVDLATGKTLATGEHKIELPATTGGNRLGVRALQGGYLVQDCMEASAAGG